MKQFVIGGLDTPEKKQEAEAILKGFGYESDEERNKINRYLPEHKFLKLCKDGFFRFYLETPNKPITLDELKAMKNPYPKVMWVWDYNEGAKFKSQVVKEIEHKGIKSYITFHGDSFSVYPNAKDIEEPIEITLDQIAEKFGVNVEQIKIKK